MSVISNGEMKTNPWREYAEKKPVFFCFLILMTALCITIALPELIRKLSPNTLSTWSWVSRILLLLSLIFIIWKLEWFDEVGLNSYVKWKDLHLLWLPAAFAIYNVTQSGNLSSILINDLVISILTTTLVFFIKELLFRGLLQRILIPSGVLFAVIAVAVFNLLYQFPLVSSIATMNLGFTSMTASEIFQYKAYLLIDKFLPVLLVSICYSAFRIRTNTIIAPAIIVIIVVVTGALSRAADLASLRLDPSVEIMKLEAIKSTVIALIYAAYGIFIIRKQIFPNLAVKDVEE